MGRALARLSGGSPHMDIDMQMLAAAGVKARTKMNGKDIVKRRAEEDRPEQGGMTSAGNTISLSE